MPNILKISYLQKLKINSDKREGMIATTEEKE
jgi:hypothetical protein